LTVDETGGGTLRSSKNSNSFHDFGEDPWNFSENLFHFSLWARGFPFPGNLHHYETLSESSSVGTKTAFNKPNGNDFNRKSRYY